MHMRLKSVVFIPILLSTGLNGNRKERHVKRITSKDIRSLFMILAMTL